MRTICITLLVATLFACIQAISISDGTNFYIPTTNAVRKHGSNAAFISSLSIPAVNQIGSTFDGVVDRTNTNLFLFSGSGTTWYITKIVLATFTVAQSRLIDRQPVAGSVMADNSYIYWLDNAPGNANTAWVRTTTADITAATQSLALNGSVTAVGPRPDPRAGSDITVDLVAYFARANSGLLQRTSTRTFTVIEAIPIPTTQNIISVQNGQAYDLVVSGSNQVVNSYFFLTSALNATGSSTTITTTAGDTVAALLEDRYKRGFLHTVLYQSGADRRYIRHVDQTLVRSNASPYTLTASAGADYLPRVDNNELHYTSGGFLYVYNTVDGTNRRASSAAGILSSVSAVALFSVIAFFMY